MCSHKLPPSDQPRPQLPVWREELPHQRYHVAALCVHLWAPHPHCLDPAWLRCCADQKTDRCGERRALWHSLLRRRPRDQRGPGLVRGTRPLGGLLGTRCAGAYKRRASGSGVESMCDYELKQIPLSRSFTSTLSCANTRPHSLSLFGLEHDKHNWPN